MARKTSPITKLEIGPTTATQNSVAARVASFSIRDMPPKINNVIERTGSPFASAIRLWESSCPSIEKKKSTLAANAATTGMYAGQPLFWEEKDSQNENVISAKIMNHE